MGEIRTNTGDWGSLVGWHGKYPAILKVNNDKQRKIRLNHAFIRN